MSRAAWPARLLVGAGLGFLRALPRSLQHACGEFIGWLTWALHIRRRVVFDNLVHAFPSWTDAERRRVARGAYRSMALAMVDSVTSDQLSDAEVAEVVAVVDWNGLDAVLARGQPVLIASAHFGSWELFAEVMARQRYVFSAVVRPLAGAFNEWLVTSRQRAGLDMIAPRGALANVLVALKNGRSVVQLIDQALPSSDAVWVPFFGRLASTTPALSMAALRSGAPVYVVAAVRDQGRLRMTVDGPVPLPEGPKPRAVLEAHTAALTAILERRIREHPEQWLWLHRRWKGAPTTTTEAAHPPAPTPGTAAG